jgi:hypothetical protein
MAADDPGDTNVSEPRPLHCLILVSLALLVSPTAAQELEQVAREFTRSLESLGKYEWKSRVEVSVGGEATSTQTYDVRYDDSGVLTRTLVEGQGTKDKAGKKAEETLSSIRQLINAYLHMKPEQLSKMFGEGSRVFEDAGEEGWTRVQALNVFYSGDQVDLWVDPTDMHLRKAEIRTRMFDQACRLLAEFEDLEYGPTYVSRSVFETAHLKKKKPTGKTMVVTTENFDHRRR